MPELPTCACIRGLAPYDRLTAIYQAAAELSGDSSLPDALCVAGVSPFDRFSFIYEAFRVLAGDDTLPSQECIEGESFQDQVSHIYQAVLAYADDESLPAYLCVRGLPIWQQWVSIYNALYVSAGSPEELVNPLCVSPTFDVLSEVFCALTATSPATLLASFYIPEIVDTFSRSVAAGYTGNGDADSYQREAAVDVLRGVSFFGSSDTTILEDVPTECVLVAPTNIVGVPGELIFSASWTAIPVTVSLLRYEWRLDSLGGWTSNGTGITLTNESATAGAHVLNVRAISTSGVLGVTGNSASFSVTAPANQEFVTTEVLGGTTSPSGEVGMEITVGAADIEISQLALWGHAGQYLATLTVYIRNAAGTDLGNVSVNTPSGTGVAGDYNWGVLGSPVTLLAGQIYYIMTQALAFNTVYNNATTVTTTTDAAVTHSAYDQPPTPDGSAGVAYGPMNFLYSLA